MEDWLFSLDRGGDWAGGEALVGEEEGGLKKEVALRFGTLVPVLRLTWLGPG